VDATLSAVAGQRCALHFDSHVGVDFDDVRSKPRDVERVLPNHLAIVPRERFEHRADLAHGSPFEQRQLPRSAAGRATVVEPDIE